MTTVFLINCIEAQIHSVLCCIRQSKASNLYKQEAGMNEYLALLLEKWLKRWTDYQSICRLIFLHSSHFNYSDNWYSFRFPPAVDSRSDILMWLFLFLVHPLPIYLVLFLRIAKSPYRKSDLPCGCNSLPVNVRAKSELWKEAFDS